MDGTSGSGMMGGSGGKEGPGDYGDLFVRYRAELKLLQSPRAGSAVDRRIPQTINSGNQYSILTPDVLFHGERAKLELPADIHSAIPFA